MSVLNKKVTTALSRLENILPLRESVAKLDASELKIYSAILTSFATQGRVPDMSELQAITAHAMEAIRILVNDGLVTVNAQGELSGAYPFCSEARGHRVQIKGQEVYAMCALDALAPSAMFECQSKVYSTCAVSHQPVNIELDIQRVINKEQCGGIYIGINWAAASDTACCADSLCTEMIFLKESKVVEEWLAVDRQYREVFTLDEAILLAATFFMPLLTHSCCLKGYDTR